MNDHLSLAAVLCAIKKGFEKCRQKLHYLWIATLRVLAIVCGGRFCLYAKKWVGIANSTLNTIVYMMFNFVSDKMAYSSPTKIPHVDGDGFSQLRDRFHLVAVST